MICQIISTDSVRSINYNAVERNMSKADAIKMVKEFRTGFVSVNESFIAYMPLHSVDKNEDWVATWMKEVTTDKKGKKIPPPIWKDGN